MTLYLLGPEVVYQPDIPLVVFFRKLESLFFCLSVWGGPESLGIFVSNP
jgi:hypothetical protein